MASAFTSWVGLVQQDPFGPMGKLAAIWFDRLVQQVPRPELVSDLIDSYKTKGKLGSATADELLQIWTPVQTLIPEYEFLKTPLLHENRSLVDSALKITLDEMRRDNPGVVEDGAFQHEMVWSSAGLIEGVGTWVALNGQGCYFYLANKLEGMVVDSVFLQHLPADEYGLFREIAEFRVPNLEAVSWDRIVELRHHSQLGQFRQKMHEMEGLVRASESNQVQKLFDEIERSDLRNLAKATRPAPFSIAMKAVASSIPLPLPINPLSVGLTVHEIMGAYKRKEKFGWLYFVMDFEKAGKDA